MLVSKSHPIFARSPIIDWVFEAQRNPNDVPTITTSESGDLSWSIDVPGVSKENLELELHGRELRLKTTRPRGDQSEVNHFRWRLPKGANTETVSAALTQGVLTLHVERLPTAAARKIPIMEENAA